MDTERFFHFQERKASCCTAFGTGSLCSSWWATLNSREQTRTDKPGWLFSTGSRASILFFPPLLLYKQLLLSKSRSSRGILCLIIPTGRCFSSRCAS
ncbi:hypothetical protein XENOCAPTIV_002408 [Xenoophorus captivus]|uniref:Uncharacterized protein n=1 Tax=Xenoophorus captivus TaxID=1517983 RepID=A0ABV0S6N5_9TELE